MKNSCVTKVQCWIHQTHESKVVESTIYILVVFFFFNFAEAFPPISHWIFPRHPVASPDPQQFTSLGVISTKLLINALSSSHVLSLDANRVEFVLQVPATLFNGSESLCTTCPCFFDGSMHYSLVVVLTVQSITFCSLLGGELRCTIRWWLFIASWSSVIAHFMQIFLRLVSTPCSISPN